MALQQVLWQTVTGVPRTYEYLGLPGGCPEPHTSADFRLVLNFAIVQVVSYWPRSSIIAAVELDHALVAGEG